MEREKQIYKVTLAGSAVNILLTAFKFAAGILGRSSAMVADAIHSLSDLLTDAVVLIFVRISSKPADSKYDYGHGKFETFAQGLVGVALLAVACGIFYHSAILLEEWLRGGDIPKPGSIALWAALLSIALKEAVFRYTNRKAVVLNSPALKANAWHHRSDALSSIATLAGIGGAILLGDRWTVLDPVASILVACFIVRISWKIFRECFVDLMEASLPEAVEKEILDVITSFPDVTDPHNLRTRSIGSRYAIEVHIRMDGNISLEEAHSRTRQIESALKEKFGPTTHVVLHVEPLEPTHVH